MSSARTLGELRTSPFSESRLASRRVKDEMRDNLMVRLREQGNDRTLRRFPRHRRL